MSSTNQTPAPGFQLKEPPADIKAIVCSRLGFNPYGIELSRQQYARVVDEVELMANELSIHFANLFPKQASAVH